MDDFEFDLYSPTSGNLSVKDGNFVDSEGRVVQLRGVNVSSSAKVYVAPFFSPELVRRLAVLLTMTTTVPTRLSPRSTSMHRAAT